MRDATHQAAPYLCGAASCAPVPDDRKMSACAFEFKVLEPGSLEWGVVRPLVVAISVLTRLELPLNASQTTVGQHVLRSLFLKDKVHQSKPKYLTDAAESG